MGKQSAGLLVFRSTEDVTEVLLVHPGGPFYENKNDGAWSIPKGEYKDTEDMLEAACREFSEETGMSIEGSFISLGNIKQKSGKTVHAWAVGGDIDVARLRSNTFTMEWPPRSGSMHEYPEVNKAEWFTMDAAKEKILPEQAEFLVRLEKILKG